jgi:hypothetical protein
LVTLLFVLCGVTLVSPPAWAATITVNAGGDFQAALDNAQPGDTIVLEAGATFTGTFILPVKAGATYITVTSSAPAAVLPAPGTRTGPMYANYLPKIVSATTAPALIGYFRAHHFRFENVEIATSYASTSASNYNLVYFGIDAAGRDAISLSELPHHFIFDRCYFHGTPTGNSRRGLALNAAAVTVQESYFSDFHEIGADSQAIAGWNGPGPFVITNNYLEAAGENIVFGGADPAITNLVPSDITIARNTFFKPLSWKVGHPSYAGSHWNVKNLLEFKNAQRVLIEGNTFENSWLDGQTGWAILLTPRNQGGRAPWSVVRDITFQHNIIRHVGGGVQILGYDDGDGRPAGTTSQPLQNVTIHNNLWYDINTDSGAPGWFLVINHGSRNVSITHNTVVDHAGGALAIFDGFAGGVAEPSLNFVYRDNLATHGLYGFLGSGTGVGAGTFTTWMPGVTFLNNVLAGAAEASYSYPDAYPTTTLFPTMQTFLSGFVNPAGGNYRLNSSSPFKNRASDGTDIGVNMDALDGLSGSSSSQIPAPPANVRLISQ